MNAIEALHVRKMFGNFAALDDVSVSIRENEFFTLLGPSGCGKTTLLRLIAGFDFPTAGEIQLYGENIASKPPYDRPVNTVFQSYALFPHLTVAQNIGFGLAMLGKPKAEIADRVDQMLSLVQMDQLRDRKTSQISGGQQQRVALARALAPAPKVLLLDEPLSALDAKLRKDMQIELKRLQAETGITFIFVTHDQEEALTMSDRIAVMNKGKILQIGSPREIYDRPSERFVANFIGDTNFLEGRVTKQTKSATLLKLNAGGEILVDAPEDARPDQAFTIVVRPEHAEIVKPDTTATLKGELENIVYFGTDTHFHVKLANGSRFTVRRQNTKSSTDDLQVGQTVGISFEQGAAQVLKD